MRSLRHLFSAVLRVFRPRPRPEDIPRRLDAQTLSRAMEEARFLYGKYKVDARAVPPGETPETRPADE